MKQDNCPVGRALLRQRMGRKIRIFERWICPISIRFLENGKRMRQHEPAVCICLDKCF